MNIQKYGDYASEGLFVLFIVPMFLMVSLCMLPFVFVGWTSDKIKLMINKNIENNK